jgi:hypothetical protein
MNTGETPKAPTTEEKPVAQDAAKNRADETNAARGRGGFGRAREAFRLLPTSRWLGTTGGGAPKHPLYVPYSERLRPFRVMP